MIIYYLPSVSKASGGIVVLLRQAKILHDAGYSVRVYYEPQVINLPHGDCPHGDCPPMSLGEKTRLCRIRLDWIDFDLTGLEIVPVYPQNMLFLDGSSHFGNQIVVNESDLFVVPEGFPNLLPALQATKCQTVVLAQGASYIWLTLSKGERWSDYGVKNVITTSREIERNINLTMPLIQTHNYYYSINRDLFSCPPVGEKKKEIVYLINRGPRQEEALQSILKIFRLAFPRWEETGWTFVKLANITRQEFATRLKQATFALVIDDYVGLPIFPLEAMACGTHVIGWPGIGGNEHVRPDSGHWSPQHSLLPTAEMINQALIDWETGQLNDRTTVYEDILSQFTPEKEQESILRIFSTLKGEQPSPLEPPPCDSP